MTSNISDVGKTNLNFGNVANARMTTTKPSQAEMQANKSSSNN